MHKETSLEIELPDGTILDAPDSADPSAVAKAYLARQQGPKQPSFGKQLASDVVRPIAKGVAALPLLAMDAGVASRNILGNAANSILGRPATDNYQLPSAMFNESLDSLTLPPTTRTGRVAETLSSMVVGAAGSAPSGISKPAPQNFVNPVQAQKQATFAAGQKEGLVAPPSSGNPSFATRMLEGIGGKIKTQQSASVRNQGVINKIMARDLGLSEQAPITKETFAGVREGAYETGYEPLKKIGQVMADSKFADDISNAAKQIAAPSRSFPGIKADPASEVIESFSQKAFDAGDAVDAIRWLRAQADDAYSSGKGSIGGAYKSASKALEGMLERHLSDQGDNGAMALQAFRRARVLIAKSHTAEKAFNEGSGNFSARSVAGALHRGVPLEGGQRTIGEFSRAFPKATQEISESFPEISPLDMYGSAIAAGSSGSPLPFLYPLSRVASRNYLLSQGGQAAAFGTKAAPDLRYVNSLAVLGQ